jgi:exopolyphosphatase/guanosine-5'-triphosphate,3'-diphosphate pyrophosphatase
LGVLPAARRGDELLGLVGTVRTLARMHLAAQAGPRRKRHALRLTLADVTALHERIEALPVRQHRHIRGLKAERADIILAGAITVEEVMRFGGNGAVTVCKGGVRDGNLWQETFTAASSPACPGCPTASG